MKLRSRLKQFVGVLKKVHLTRDYPGDPRQNGFVLAQGRSLVLLQLFHDFYNEGYTAIRLRDVTSIRSGKFERFWEEMFRQEGLMDKVGLPCHVPLDSMKALLSYFKARRQNVIVECESRESSDDAFYIGRVLRVGPETIAFRHFSALGKWETKPYRVRIDDISKVSFDTPYVNTFSKYVE